MSLVGVCDECGKIHEWPEFPSGGCVNRIKRKVCILCKEEHVYKCKELDE